MSTEEKELTPAQKKLKARLPPEVYEEMEAKLEAEMNEYKEKLIELFLSQNIQKKMEEPKDDD